MQLTSAQGSQSLMRNTDHEEFAGYTDPTRSGVRRRGVREGFPEEEIES